MKALVKPKKFDDMSNIFPTGEWGTASHRNAGLNGIDEDRMVKWLLK